MGIEHLSPITLTHTEAASETLKDICESFAEFDALDLEGLLACLEENDDEV